MGKNLMASESQDVVTVTKSVLKLSVIIPVWNVETYLSVSMSGQYFVPECIRV